MTGSSAALSLSKSVAFEMFSAALVEEAEEPILRKASGSSGSMPGGRRRDLVGDKALDARRELTYTCTIGAIG